MLSILVLVFLSCNMHGATLRAKRGSNLCATAQKLMRNGLRRWILCQTVPCQAGANQCKTNDQQNNAN